MRIFWTHRWYKRPTAHLTFRVGRLVCRPVFVAGHLVIAKVGE
jgi:hypothetical protein